MEGKGIRGIEDAAAIFLSPLFLFSRSKRHWMWIEYRDGSESKIYTLHSNRGYDVKVKDDELLYMGRPIKEIQPSGLVDL